MGDVSWRLAIADIAINGIVMLPQRTREMVRAIATGNEIERFARQWIHRCLQGGTPRHGNRRGRYAVNDVSVIGRGLANIGAGNSPLITLPHTVNNRRVGLQAHALLHAALEHTGNFAPLLGRTGFPLDQGGHNQRFVGGVNG